MQRLFSRKGLALIGILALLIILFMVFGGNQGETTEPEVEDAIPTVQLISAGSLEGSATLSTVGEVRSVSEATLRAKRTGEITQVNVSAGSSVSAGTIIAQMENATERAQVAQARAALQAQEANLLKVQNGTRNEQLAVLESSLTDSKNAYEQAKIDAVNALQSSFTTAQQTIYGSIDTFFRDPRTYSARLIPSSATFDESTILERQRIEFEQILEAWELETASYSVDMDLDAALTLSETRTREIQRFLNSLSRIVSDQEARQGLTAADIDAQEAVVNGAQATIEGELAAISGASRALSGSLASSQIASENLQEGVTGARQEDIDAAVAAVEQSRASLALSQATFEQTVARAPISGVVSNLAVSRGDFVSNGELIAVVDNPNALQIESFVSASLKDQLSAGMPAEVAEQYAGVVATIDPGLDPVTRKARVLISVSEGEEALTRGDVVAVSFLPEDSEESEEEIEQGPLLVPLAALKIRPEAKYIFTVNNGVLESTTVTTGAVIGDAIQIVEGLSFGELIVEDVRGLRVGDEVEIAE